VPECTAAIISCSVPDCPAPVVACSVPDVLHLEDRVVCLMYCNNSSSTFRCVILSSYSREVSPNRGAALLLSRISGRS
jgi:hypothetical protein